MSNKIFYFDLGVGASVNKRWVAMFKAEDLINRFKSMISNLSHWEYTHCTPQQSSIGGHLRHVIDFFNTFVRDYPQKNIHYDHRERSKYYESNPSFALLALNEKLYQLESLCKSECPNTPLTVNQSIDSSGKQMSVPSTLMREVLFIQDHAIHHLAIIQIKLLSMGKKIDLKLSENYSTQAHYNKS